MDYQGFKFAQEGIERLYAQLSPILQCNKEPTVVFGPISSMGAKDGKCYTKADELYTKTVDQAIEEYQQALPRGSGFFDSSSLLTVIDLVANNNFYQGRPGIYILAHDTIALAPTLSVPLIPHIYQLPMLPKESLDHQSKHLTRVFAHELLHWAMAQSAPFEELRAFNNKDDHELRLEGKKLEDVLHDAEKHPEKQCGEGPMEKIGKLGLIHFLEHAGGLFEQVVFSNNETITPIEVKNPKDREMYLHLAFLLNQYGVQGYVKACRETLTEAWDTNTPLA